MRSKVAILNIVKLNYITKLKLLKQNLTLQMDLCVMILVIL
ncbi:hypothetical protein FORMB_14510 [Formosa sp. Hel1_33_131]|nr:hypothetical protein FORMB_14510 [Formosa sp. Hel1_33_131]